MRDRVNELRLEFWIESDDGDNIEDEDVSSEFESGAEGLKEGKGR